MIRISDMKRPVIIAVAAIVIGYAVLCGITISRTAGTCDEIAYHIVSGYSFLKTADFRINPSAPPLIRQIMALPLIILNPRLPIEDESWRRLDSIRLGRQFFYVVNKNADMLINTARCMIALLGIILGIFIFFWSKRLYGPVAGVFTLFLYSFSPMIISNSSLATLDIGFSLFLVLSIYYFVKFLNNPTFITLGVATIFFGLVQAAKFTAVFLYPLYFFYLIIHLLTMKDSRRLKLAGGLLFIFIVSLLVIWAVYFFEYKPFLKNVANPEEKLEFACRILSPLVSASSVTEMLRNLKVPLSTHITGIFGIFKHAHTGHLMYFIGNWGTSGSRLYYLVAFLIKTPIPILIFIIWSLMLFVRERKVSREEGFIIVTVAFLFLIASASKLQLGLRYILPVYPLLFVIAGKVLAKDNGFGWIPSLKGMAIIFLCIWCALGTVIITPHTLSYFNEFIGGPKNGYKFVRDSDLDWGQDLKELKRVLDANGIQRVRLCYFGQALPEYYGISYETTDKADYDRPREKNVYAISAEYLDTFVWTKKTRPFGRAGYSILIYKF